MYNNTARMILLVFLLVILLGIFLGIIFFKKEIVSQLPSPSVNFDKSRSNPDQFFALGETMKLGDWALTFSKVVEDSRCPDGVDCVHPGKISIEVLAENATQRKTFFMSSPPQSLVHLGTDAVNLRQVDPMRAVGKTLNERDYRIAYRVTTIDSILQILCNAIPREKGYTLEEYANDKNEIGGFIAFSLEATGAPIFYYDFNGAERAVVLPVPDFLNSPAGQAADLWQKNLLKNFPLKSIIRCP